MPCSCQRRNPRGRRQNCGCSSNPRRRNPDPAEVLSSLENGAAMVVRQPPPEWAEGMVRSKWVTARAVGTGIMLQITKRGRAFLARIRGDADQRARASQGRLWNGTFKRGDKVVRAENIGGVKVWRSGTVQRKVGDRVVVRFHGLSTATRGDLRRVLGFAVAADIVKGRTERVLPENLRHHGGMWGSVQRWAGWQRNGMSDKAAVRAAGRLGARQAGKAVPGLGQVLAAADAIPEAGEEGAGWLRHVRGVAREVGGHARRGRFLRAGSAGVRGSIRASGKAVKGSAKVAIAAIASREAADRALTNPIGPRGYTRARLAKGDRWNGALRVEPSGGGFVIRDGARTHGPYPTRAIAEAKLRAMKAAV